MKSLPNTVSIILTGPWNHLWTEEIDDDLRLLGSGSKILNSSNKNY